MSTFENQFLMFTGLRPYLYTIFIILLAFIKSNAQQVLSAKEYNADIDELIVKLKKHYSGIYYYESPEDFEDRIKSYYLAEGDSISVLKAYQQIAELVAGHQDLHIAAYLPKKYFNKHTKVFPLILRKFDDEFYVAYNQSGDSTLRRGDRVLSIDGISPLIDYNNFRTLYGADFNNPYSKNYYAVNRFGTYYARWYDIKDSIEVVSHRNRFAPIDRTVLLFPEPKAALDTTKARYKDAFRKNFDYKIIDSANHTGHLDITSFVGNRKILNINDVKFKKDLKRTFKTIEEDSIQNLVLDLRGNGGGNIVNVKRLLNYLLEEPYDFYDTISVSKQNFNKIFKPYLVLPYLGGRIYFPKKSGEEYYRTQLANNRNHRPKHNYQNNLIVLMDGGSYSATTFTISLLKDKNRATFVGTQPGGASWGSFAGMFYNTKLSNSKIGLRIPQMKIVHSQKANEDFFVQPDYYVGQSFEDFLKREDTLIEFVKELVK